MGMEGDMLVRNAVVFSLFYLCIVIPATGEKALIVADEWPQMEVLGEYLHDKGGYEIEKVEQDKMPKDLSGYDGVFQFVHGMLKDDAAQALMDYAENGGRLIVLHHGISTAKKKTRGWLSFLGIELDRNKKEAKYYYEWIHGVTLILANVNPNHYITSHGVSYRKTIEYQPSDEPSTPIKAPVIEFENTEVFLNHQFTGQCQV